MIKDDESKLRWTMDIRSLELQEPEVVVLSSSGDCFKILTPLIPGSGTNLPADSQL